MWMRSIIHASTSMREFRGILYAETTIRADIPSRKALNFWSASFALSASAGVAKFHRSCFPGNVTRVEHKKSTRRENIVMMTSSNGSIFPRYWPIVRGIHRSPANSPHKGKWRGALTFSLICACIYGWVNNRKAGDLRRHHAHYDVTVMHLVTFISRWSLQLCYNVSFIFFKLCGSHQWRIHSNQSPSVYGFGDSALSNIMKQRMLILMKWETFQYYATVMAM